MPLNEEAGYKRMVNWPIFRDSLALGNGKFSLFVSPRMTCTFLYHMSVLKHIMHCFLLIEQSVK